MVRPRGMTILLLLLWIIVETTTATTPTVAHYLDLSYLFRTKSSSIAAAIQRCYQQLYQQQQQQQQQKIDEDCLVVELDVTSSLMGKNLTTVLVAALSKPSASIKSSSIMFLRLTAKRNQWTSHEGTIILQYLLDLKHHQHQNEDKEIDQIDDRMSTPSSSGNQTVEGILHNATRSDDTTMLHDATSLTSQVSDDSNATIRTIEGTSRNIKAFQQTLQEMLCSPQQRVAIYSKIKNIYNDNYILRLI
jgi:hypothetical protein